MIEELLDTGVKIRIARLMVEQDGELTASEVSRNLGISKSRASQCLRDLNSKGILTKRPIGRSILYGLSSNKLAESIRHALTYDRGLLKDIERAIAERLRKLNPVSIAIFGSAVNGLSRESDVDVLVVHKGNLDSRRVAEIASDITVEYGFNISILTVSQREFANKARKGEEFALNVIASHKLLYGKSLEEVAWSGT